jgi:hypothetical protein
MQSPEFGAGPTLAAASPQTMLDKTTSSIAAPTSFFMFFPPVLLSKILFLFDLRDSVENPFQKMKHPRVYT